MSDRTNFENKFILYIYFHLKSASSGDFLQVKYNIPTVV